MRAKTAILVLFTLLLTSVLAGCGSANETVPAPEEPSAEVPQEIPADEPAKEVATEEKVEEAPIVTETVMKENKLIMGDTTEASGDWETFWASSGTDFTVLELTRMQGTVEWDFEGNPYVNKTAVENVESTENSDGSVTYTWMIKEGLLWSDGTPITAEDFVSGILFSSSPQMAMFDSLYTRGSYLKGYGDFRDGNTRIFEGVNLIDDRTFALTIDALNRPNFYEQFNASSVPFKLSYWIGDGAGIKDDGEGCYFVGEFAEMIDYESGINVENLTAEQGAIFDKYNEMVQKARYGVENWPSSGPYVIDSFDKKTKEVVLSINHKYPGNYEGVKPSIETIVIQLVNTETAMEQLRKGELSLLSNISSGSEIKTGLELIEKGEEIDFITYPRAGYGMIDFKCDVGPTRFVEVRQALAKLLDRDEFVQRYTDGFGTLVHGPYGEGQWFYQETKDELLGLVDLYEYSPEEAVLLLEKAGFIFNETGEDFQEGDQLRYRRGDDGELEPLIIKWSSSGNAVSKMIDELLVENPEVKKAGVIIEEDIMDFTELFRYNNRDKSDEKYVDNDYNMFNLATNFSKIYDMSGQFTTDPQRVALGSNLNYLLDPALEAAADAIVMTEPGDREAFKDKFVDFVVIWNQLLPQIPLYSNEIHDFFSLDVVEYKNSAIADMSLVLLYAKMAK